MKFLLSMKERGKDPEALRNRPEIDDCFAELLIHFNRLSSSRTFGMNGPNPIDFLSIFYYNTTIARLDLEFFLQVIQMLDTEYLNWDAKKSNNSIVKK